MTVAIAAIAGSLRCGSFNRMLLQPTARPPPAARNSRPFTCWTECRRSTRTGRLTQPVLIPRPASR